MRECQADAVWNMGEFNVFIKKLQIKLSNNYYINGGEDSKIIEKPTK